MDSDVVEAKHIHTVSRIKKILKSNPLEWVFILKVGISTIVSRYLYRCTGNSTIVGGNVSFINFSNIRIGSNCLILDHVYMRAGMDGSITIGDGCAINSYVKIFGHGGVKIGNNSQMGPGAQITTTTHDIKQFMKTEFKPVSIGEWSWIGANAIVLPGITIGEYSVVGAGSIVTKDVPDYAIVAGNPARIIGENEIMKSKNMLDEAHASTFGDS